MVSVETHVNGHGVVTFEGDLTITHAHEIRNVLVNVLNKADAVRMDVRGVTGADLAGLQVLCSAHRTAMHQGKQLSYDGAVPEPIGKAIEEAGFSRPSGCALARSKSCIWIVKGSAI